MYEVSRAMLPPQSAQRVAFDTHYELLYSGGADGSLHGLELSHMGLRFRVQAAPAACERGVLGLACNAAGVWSCSEAGVRLHSRGGLMLHGMAGGNLPAACEALCWSDDASRFLVVGGEGGLATVDTGAKAGPQVVTAVKPPTPVTVTDVCLAGRFLAAGSADGSVRLYDARLRSPSAQHTFPLLHAGGITQLCWCGAALLSVGSAYGFHPDVALQLLDLRMLSPRAPILSPATLPAPVALARLPAGYVGERCVALSADGAFQVLHVDQPHAAADAPFDRLAPSSYDQDFAAEAAFRCLAASPSGALLAAGSDAGAAVVLCDAAAESPRALLNAPLDLPVPQAPNEPPPVPVDPYLSEASPFGPYRALAPPAALASAFRPTPWVLGAALKKKPRRLVAEALRRRGGANDFVENSEKWRPNALLYGAAARAARAYDRGCDPRRRAREEGASALSEEERALAEAVPPHLRLPTLKRERRSFAYDFARHNATPFLGLENLGPNVYVAAFVQLLYHTPEVRTALLRTLEDERCADSRGVAAELALVFDALDFGGHTHAAPRLRSARLAPLLRALHGVSETAALPILDNSPTSEGHGIARRLELFAGWLLRSAAEAGWSACFAHDCEVRGRVVGAGGEEIDAKVSAVCMTALAHREPKAPFEETLAASLAKVSRARAWSQRQGAYVPIEQRRTPLSLPRLLLLGCSEVAAAGGGRWRLPEHLSLGLEGGAVAVAGGPERAEGCALYRLEAVVSLVDYPGDRPHFVCHARVHDSYKRRAERRGWPRVGDYEWILLNDFQVTPSSALEAADLRDWWRRPVAIHYRRVQAADGAAEPAPEEIDAPVYSFAPFLAAPIAGAAAAPKPEDFPGEGEPVALDAEFVATETEKTAVTPEGRRVTISEARQSPARVSVVNAAGEVVIDDYVAQLEKVEDFLTRFSGVTSQDLDPLQTRRRLVSYRVAALKLRWLLQRGVHFVGHGVSSDFRTLDLPVPPGRIRDTVELWSLPNQRKVSLRFLASFLLNEAIQDETHDSLEDARMALALYGRWSDAKASGAVEQILSDLYATGQRQDWILGAEAIVTPQKLKGRRAVNPRAR